MKSKSLKLIIVSLLLIMTILLGVNVTKVKKTTKKFEISNPHNASCSISAMSAEQQDAGSDIMVDYESLFVSKMSAIPVELLQLVTEEQMQSYLSDYENNIVQMGFISTSASEGINVLSFIKYFNITKEEFIDATKSLNTFDMLSDEYKYTNKDIDMLFCDNESEINAYFASNYCIVCDGYVYSPKWLFNHTINEITNTGITAEMIQEKIPYYEKLPLITTEREKFQELLSDVIGEEINLDVQDIYNYYPYIYFDNYTIQASVNEYSILWLAEHDFKDYEINGIDKKSLEKELNTLKKYSDTIEYKKIYEQYTLME